MHDTDEFRAGEAARLLNEPLLVEALDKIEQASIEAMISAPRTPEGDQERRMHADKVEVIRGLKAELETMIAIGSQATKGATLVA